MARTFCHLLVFSPLLCSLLAAQLVILDNVLTPIYMTSSNASTNPFEAVSSPNTTIYVNQFGFPFTPSAFTPSPGTNAMVLLRVLSRRHNGLAVVLGPKLGPVLFLLQPVISIKPQWRENALVE
jgi:hypothetical protein